MKYWVFDTDLATEFTYNLTIVGAVNPVTTEPLTGFTLDFTDGVDRVLMHAPHQLTLHTSEPSELTSIYLIQSSTDPLALSDYIIRFGSVEEIQEINISLTFPDCMSFTEQRKESFSITDQFQLAINHEFISDVEI